MDSLSGGGDESTVVLLRGILERVEELNSRVDDRSLNRSSVGGKEGGLQGISDREDSFTTDRNVLENISGQIGDLRMLMERNRIEGGRESTATIACHGQGIIPETCKIPIKDLEKLVRDLCVIRQRVVDKNTNVKRFYYECLAGNNSGAQ